MGISYAEKAMRLSFDNKSTEAELMALQDDWSLRAKDNPYQRTGNDYWGSANAQHRAWFEAKSKLTRLTEWDTRRQNYRSQTCTDFNGNTFGVGDIIVWTWGKLLHEGRVISINGTGTISVEFTGRVSHGHEETEGKRTFVRDYRLALKVL